MAIFSKLPFYLLITAGIGGGSGGGAHFEGFDGNFPKFTFRRAEDIFKYDHLSIFLLYRLTPILLTRLCDQCPPV